MKKLLQDLALGTSIINAIYVMGGVGFIAAHNIKPIYIEGGVVVGALLMCLSLWLAKASLKY